MPKKQNLFDRIASFSALRNAAIKAVKGKRAKPTGAAFLANLEREVLSLESELTTKRYRPGRYKTIEVFDSQHCAGFARPHIVAPDNINSQTDQATSTMQYNHSRLFRLQQPGMA